MADVDAVQRIREVGQVKEITLGCRAKDDISGFSGIVIAITTWLNGCVRVTIQPQELREGKRIETDTFDIEQVVYLGVGTKINSVPSGGDRPSIGRAKDPR